MVLPLIPVVLGVGSGLAAAGGVAAGAVGGQQIKRAQSRMRRSQEEYEARFGIHLELVDKTNERLLRLGEAQARAQADVVSRMSAFLKRHEKQVRNSDLPIVDGVDGSPTPMEAMAKLDPDVATWVGGAIGSVAVSVATPAAIRIAIVQFASASTGTAISALHGIAATNATLAAIGGGAVAAGGGGMALGATMLNVATAGPGILVAGLMVKNRGTKARTEAAAHQAELAIAMAELDEHEELLRAVRSRADELHDTLTRLVARARAALDELESEPFQLDRHGERLQTALLLTVSVRDVARAPITDEQGNLRKDTAALILKYRTTDTEDSDD